MSLQSPPDSGSQGEPAAFGTPKTPAITLPGQAGAAGAPALIAPGVGMPPAPLPATSTSVDGGATGDQTAPGPASEPWHPVLVLILGFVLFAPIAYLLPVPFAPCGVAPLPAKLPLLAAVPLLFLLWRRVRLPAGVPALFKPFNNFVEGFLMVLGKLQPGRPRDRVLWVLFLVVLALGAAGWMVGVRTRPPEPLPGIKHFAASYGDGRGLALQPGATITVSPGEGVDVEAVLLRADGARCAWTAAGGADLPVQGSCAAHYTAPLRRMLDLLSVNVESACGTQQAVWSVNVEVVEHP